MENSKIIRAMQRYVANVSIAPSTLHNQGAEKVVEKARQFLAGLDLRPLRALDPADFPTWLDQTTKKLQRCLPRNARKFGTARKAINVFLVQAALNRILSAEFSLSRLQNVMETPLDSQAAAKLRRAAKTLTRWPGVRGLKQKISDEYQGVALRVAKTNGLSRACVDVILFHSE